MGRGGGGGGGDLLTCKVLRHIRGYYREAIEQLPVEEFPSLLTAGACFGLLDPVSNIIVNTATAAADTTYSSTERKRKRKRSQQQQQMLIDKKKVLALVDPKPSLYGMLSFLVSHFRYLDTREALRYLRLAKADLLVAVRLIDLDRLVTSPSSNTNPSSTSFRVALRCAAVSSKHPCPDAFAAIWLSLASSPPTHQRQEELLRLSSHPHMQEVLLALSLPAAGLNLISYAAIESNPRRLKSVLKFHKQRCREKEVPPELTEPRIYLLLDMIHCVYIKAIARFPMLSLQAKHHRGLLKAGHCFGPMDDPVSNVILNTIWYDTVFPTEDGFLADMLLTRSLARIQARSAAGLVSFLCARFPGLPRRDAIAFLLEAGANLGEAVSRAQCEGHHPSDLSLEEAYKDAALDAWHPEPEALAKFMQSPVSTVPSQVLSKLKMSDCPLTTEEVEAISASLDAHAAGVGCRSTRQVPELYSWVGGLVKRYQDRFCRDQLFFRRIADTALKSVMQWPGYQLHIICGVNEMVPEDGKHDYYYLIAGHPHCHINFLARPWGSPSAAPTLFFAECSNDDHNTKVSSCCVVDPATDDGRCFHCEQQGAKVVHPSFGRYRGCDTDFVDMARGKGITSTNKQLVCGSSRTKVFWLTEEDSVYFDPRWDTKLAEYINKAEEKKDADPEDVEPII